MGRTSHVKNNIVLLGNWLYVYWKQADCFTCGRKISVVVAVRSFTRGACQHFTVLLCSHKTPSHISLLHKEIEIESYIFLRLSLHCCIDSAMSLCHIAHFLLVRQWNRKVVIYINGEEGRVPPGAFTSLHFLSAHPQEAEWACWAPQNTVCHKIHECIHSNKAQSCQVFKSRTPCLICVMTNSIL